MNQGWTNVFFSIIGEWTKAISLSDDVKALRCSKLDDLCMSEEITYTK